MTEDNINDSNGSFGKSYLSSSIYFEDENAADQLSKIIANDLPNNELQKCISDLNEKNEFKSAYKKKESLSDKMVQESFKDENVKTTDKQLESNLDKVMYSKVKSNEIKEEDNLYLKIEDFPNNPIADSFIYDEAVDKIKIYIPIYEEELNKMDVNNLKRENIYKGRGVEVMVEQTYCYDKFLKNQMIEEACYLKRIMNCWRRVAGDGNCFYRSVIFSWLEYLIFNKKINTLKIVMANLYTKFDPNYVKNKELPLYIKKQFITEERFLVLAILEIIIRQLKQNQIEKAYLTLLKAFNVTRVFDRIMIFYLRYILYEFISDNQAKLYRKDFPVLLGNLLPQEYERDDGTFLYKEYFIKDLLKFYTCAEKLAVYLVPFVLKVNLNIVFYYFGNDCDIENKFFSCYLPNKDKIKDTINVLYRKAHYDVCYTKEYYNNFEPLLEKYSNLKVDFCLINPSIVQQNEKILNEINPFNPEVSVVFNRVLFAKKKNEMQKEKQKEKEKETKKETKKEEIKDNNNNHNMDINEKDLTGDIILNGIIKKHPTDKCFICGKSVNNNEGNKEILPCKCNISFCSEQCKEKYYKGLVAFYNTMEFGINIKCGNNNNFINRMTIIQDQNLDNDNVKNALKNKMFEFFKKYCMNCLTPIVSQQQYKMVKCKCPQLHKLLDTNKFEHRFCKECAIKNSGNCKICNLYHSRIVN